MKIKNPKIIYNRRKYPVSHVCPFCRSPEMSSAENVVIRKRMYVLATCRICGTKYLIGGVL